MRGFFLLGIWALGYTLILSAMLFWAAPFMRKDLSWREAKKALESRPGLDANSERQKLERLRRKGVVCMFAGIGLLLLGEIIRMVRG